MADEIFNQRYNNLNERQKEAVEAVEGPVLVVAGPGSGKTELLSLRVANILKKTDTLPGNILCLTFTESAAFNMRDRLSGLIAREAYRVAVHTFHSFCVEVINRHPEFFYQGATFAPADELGQIEVVEEILSELPHENPLSAQHPEQGYTYLSDTRNAIAALKKAGIGDVEFSAILDHNEKSLAFVKDKIHEVLKERISLKQFGNIQNLIQCMRSYSGGDFPVRHMNSYLTTLAFSLERALEEAKSSGKAAPLSAWKTKWTFPPKADPPRAEKVNAGRRVLKDEARLERMRAVSFVYKEYRKRMRDRGYYDFEDMLLDVIEVLSQSDVLRAELQEQYQYILVDEFQDTNDAQMRLLYLVGESDINEGRPNIMAVGDDDQAIFRFQGGEVSNIVHFVHAYRNVRVIALTHSYRSAASILRIAESIIEKGTERLSKLIPGLEKKLIAAGKDLGEGNIVSKSFITKAEEYYFISKQIQRLLKEGKKPSDIALIARHHRDLEAAALFLQKAGVAIHYERQRDVLKEPHIRQLIQMSRLACALLRKKFDEVDYLLPEILSYPFWEITRKAIWDVALCAASSGRRKSWISVMLESRDERVKNIAEFFVDMARRVNYEPLEYALDSLIGSKGEGFTSPFKKYYFSKERFSENKPEYLSFLSSLRAFVNALREYKRGEPLRLEDVIVFTDIHIKSKMPVPDTSPYVNARDSVHLLSAHKAKGLEFETVFIVSAQNDIWAGRGRAAKLQFPINLPVSPAGDSIDDQLRLFYVALTRAKKNLYITSHKFADNGKESLRLQFLADCLDVDEENSEAGEMPNAAQMFSYSWAGFYQPPFAKDEQASLEARVKDYRMSVTHLNNFLDVVRGGPQFFLEQNLLLFPQAKSVSAVYGSSMHKTLQMLYLDLKKNGAVPELSWILSWFEDILYGERLSKNDFNFFLKRGKDSLTEFYNAKREIFRKEHEIEVDFRGQGVVVGAAHLSGKIDKIVKVSPDEIIVYDFKTGKAFESWKDGDPKILRYKRQIMFYKLLVENSRDFGGKYKVKTGVLEFLEPRNGVLIDLALDIRASDLEKTSRLVEAVFSKIKNLDFPDVSSYSKDSKGILCFEEDLLEGKV